MARSRNIGGQETAAREGGKADHSRARAQARTTRLNLEHVSDNGGGGFLRTLLQPSALFCVALAAFLIVSGMKIWEDGWLDPLFAPKGAGPIEKGPIRFDPRTRQRVPEYTAAPAPAAGAQAENAAAGE